MRRGAFEPAALRDRAGVTTLARGEAYQRRNRVTILLDARRVRHSPSMRLGWSES
jgi:hypothetical protein